MSFSKGCILAFLLSSFILSGQSIAQEIDAPFSIDVINVRSEDSDSLSRLDLFVAVPNSSLRFFKEGDVFTSRYEVEVEVYGLGRGDRVQKMVDEEIWEGTVTVEDFSATHSIKYGDHSSASFVLDPGRYLVRFYVRDKASLEVYNKELITELRMFSNDISISDLILVDEYDLVTHAITPSVSDRVYTDASSFKVFYELYARDREQVRINVQLIRTSDSRGLPLLRWLFRKWQDERMEGAITYNTSRSFEVVPDRMPALVDIPINDFEAGEYLVRVAVENRAGDLLDFAERAVTLQWADETEYEGRDIDEAIAQLRYIAKPKELREIREASSKQERQERFFAFWKKRDPTPNTPENESMEEYYLRVDYANRHYTGRRNGWETDRGHTLVLYGEPDEVDIGASSVDINIEQPYEVWYYHRIGRRFIFVDRTGSGNFELMIPAWDQRSFIR